MHIYLTLARGRGQVVMAELRVKGGGEGPKGERGWATQEWDPNVGGGPPAAVQPKEKRGERGLPSFFSPSFSPPTVVLRQNINTYSQSHTMFAATNVQQTAFVGKAVAMKSRTMVRYESVVGYVRVIVYCFLSGV